MPRRIRPWGSASSTTLPSARGTPRSLGYERVFIIDFDAHHGNGTQHIFEEDDTVFYFSTHQHPYYPETGKDMERGKGKGVGYTYNVPILAGSGNREYLSVYQDILPGVISRFDPDIVLVSAGYDIHVNDPHANIRVSHEGVHGIVRSILSSSECPWCSSSKEDTTFLRSANRFRSRSRRC